MRSARPGGFRLPSPEQRVLILGSTGSGKTTMGAWLLSRSPFDEMPYVIIDYKRDELLNSIQRRREIDLNTVPTKPGVYHLKPNPVIDDDAVENWLFRVWRKTNIGLYVDEALRIPVKRTGAFESILTQGRSLRIPVISLSQRPVDLTRYAFSESNHVAAFRLTDMRDRKKVAEYIPALTPDYELPDYHSYWYDVGSNRRFIMTPVPPAEEILDTFDYRLEPKRRAI